MKEEDGKRRGSDALKERRPGVFEWEEEEEEEKRY